MTTNGSRWAGGAGQQGASGPAWAQSGQWWAAAHDGRSWVRCDSAVGGAEGEGAGCSQDEAAAAGGGGGCGAVEEAAVGGWPERGGGG